jgi:hypothetical protein
MKNNSFKVTLLSSPTHFIDFVHTRLWKTLTHSIKNHNTSSIIIPNTKWYEQKTYEAHHHPGKKDIIIKPSCHNAFEKLKNIIIYARETLYKELEYKLKQSQ